MARGTVWLEQVTSSSTRQPGCGQSSERPQTPRTVSCFRSTGSALPAGRPAPTTSIRVKKSASRSSRAGWGLRVAGVERQHGSGYTIVVPACVPHAAWNAGDGEVHVLVDFRPALRTEVAFEALAGLARDGKTTGAGVPRNPFRLALVLREFADEIRFVRPPLAVQKAILGPLARLGRTLGYRAEYTYRQDVRQCGVLIEP
jgi:hypothetical protein